MYALLGRKRLRQLHLHGCIEVAGIGTVGRRHAVPLQPEGLAVLRRRRHLQPQGLACNRRDLRLAAQHRRGQGDLNLGVQVFALAFELRMGREPDAQIEVAYRPAPTAQSTEQRDPAG